MRFFSLLLVLLIAPNLAAWGSSYLLGPGFALGSGTVVAPSGVALGPVPAVPVLAAVPDVRGSPTWLLSVLAVPVLCGLLVGWTRRPALPLDLVRGRGAAARPRRRCSRAVATGVLAWLSGGAVGRRPDAARSGPTSAPCC